MIILVVNSGSSSLKFQLLNMNDESIMAKGVLEKIGLSDSIFTLKYQNESHTEVSAIANHEAAVEIMLNALLSHEAIGLKSLEDINAVGHRVVQGGDSFDRAVIINDEIKQQISDYAVMAPLHNPAHLAGIEACAKSMPNTPQIAVFDTAFQQTMEPSAYVYGLPYELAQKHKIRRYGAHGTSHKYVSHEAAEFLGKPIEELKIITCHLGNGSSIAAVEHGKAIDISMGFTPHEGLLMGTRCGDIDATAVLYLMQRENLTAAEMDTMLNKQSGLLGISGVSSDFRDLDNAIAEGNERAKLAKDIFIRRVKKYIGSYAALMNGVDAIVFTAGIGENGWDVREAICSDLDFLGVKIDVEKNKCRGKLVDFSTDDAKVRCIVVPTNEELAIATEAAELIKK